MTAAEYDWFPQQKNQGERTEDMLTPDLPIKNSHVKFALIGGMDRLRQHYIEEAAKSGIELRVFSQAEINMKSKLQKLDGVVIFTNKISHQARNDVLQTVRSRNIPLMMSHSCGICSFRKCIDCLVNQSLSSASL